MSVRWFVSRDLDGTVSHLVRIVETETSVSGAFLRDGVWHEDGAVMDYLLDPTLGEEVEAARGESLANDLGAPPTDLRSGFRSYFAGAGLELPDPIPPVGLARNHEWTVRYKLSEGHDRLDFLAINDSSAPLHGAIHHDGSIELFDTYVDHSTHNPSLGETAEDGERRMAEHNERVTAELTRKGLI